MKNILYIGNKLAGKGKTATTIDTLGSLLQEEGYHIKYASSCTNKLLRLLHMMSATCRVRNWADIVLIDTYSTNNFWYAILIAKICDKMQLKYIPILHGGNLPNRLIQNPKTVDTFIKKAHQVVSPSDFLGSAFAKAGYTKIVKIHNFIELENYPFTKRTNIKPRLLWVRSFAQIYNPQMAVKVLHVLKQYFPEASLTMVGPEKDGSQKTCRKLAKELQLEIKLTGLLSKKEWIELSKEHDIFINTTHFDNLPVSVVEAMALGLPVISTNVGGIPYLIEDQKNGKLVPDNDVDLMVKSIEDVIFNKLETSTMVLKARKSAEEFSWTKICKKWNSLLRS